MLFTVSATKLQRPMARTNFTCEGCGFVINYLQRSRKPWVYLAMDKYSELAPWILGGLSTAAVAVAITLGANHRTAPTSLPAPSASIAERLPAASAINPPPPLAAAQWSSAQLSSAAPPAGETSSPVVSQAVDQSMQPLTQPVVAAGQIWECTTNGQRTFSNNPCGEKSSLRKFGPLNTMDPTPVLRNSRPYQPEPGYAPAYAQDYDNSGTQDYADDLFQGPLGIPYFGHRRGEGMHRPYHHAHGPAPRRN
jgi:hypothetical protein